MQRLWQNLALAANTSADVRFFICETLSGVSLFAPVLHLVKLQGELCLEKSL
jgi:hypothetical protein